MDDFHERVALARELDEVKRDLAARAKNRLIVMTENKWNALSPSTLEFLLKHNGNVMDQLRKAEIQNTIHMSR